MSSIVGDLTDLASGSYFLLGLLAVNGLAILYFVKKRGSEPIPSPKDHFVSEEKKDGIVVGVTAETPSPLGTVVPLKDFDWKTTEPLKLRPFKPKYHLTMALETTNLNDLIVMDKNYLDRVSLRKKVIAEYPSTVVGHLPGTQAAVKEFYELFTKTLLPVRWPSMFKSSNGQVQNLVTGDIIPSNCPESVFEALSHIGRNLDEDFLILLPSDDGDGHTLKAFVACFPSGFDTSKKMGLKLRDIHTPVPRYKEKLQTSMDRYFAKLEVGKFARRVNWSVMTNDQLFTAFALTHFHEGKHTKDDHPDEVDVNNTYQRTEMQSLFRLPESGALIFVIKTYMYPIQQVKDDGYGEDFAAAIEGLSKGNVPEMHFYKRGPVWAENVVKFLRS